MKRGGPLKRKTPLKSNSGLNQGGSLKRTELKKRSSKRQSVMTNDRIPLIQALIEAGSSCEICPMFLGAGLEIHCAGRIEGLHERRKRSSGGSLVHRDNLIPSCNWANSFIECNPDQIRLLFGDVLVVREGDDEWKALSKRNDRFE